MTLEQELAALNGLGSWPLTARMIGAYQDPNFLIDGIDEPISLASLLAFLLSRVGAGGGGGVSIGGEFANDAAAGVGSVPIGGFYVLNGSNTYGLPRGTVKKRIT